MKTIRFLLTLAIVVPVLSCNGQQEKKVTQASPATPSDKIEAYYFHFTARCPTCKTIEADAKKNLEILYPAQVKAGLISFQSVNLDDAANKPLAEKLGISGQTLLLVKGNKKINITNEGFLYAVAKPDKFKEVINEKVESLRLDK
jgi:hypothetical protein